MLVLWEVDSVFVRTPAYTRWSVQTRFPGRSGTDATASLVAAPVRSAAPVRRHQSLMSDLDRPDAAGDPLRCENVLFCYRASVHEDFVRNL